jgi:hypothetical protein
MTTDNHDAGHGALFRNDKRTKDSHPNYKGDVTIDGMKYWVSGWIKQGAWQVEHEPI